MIIKLFKIKVNNALMLCKGCEEELYAPGGLRMQGGPPDESKYSEYSVMLELIFWTS